MTLMAAASELTEASSPDRSSVARFRACRDYVRDTFA
jgi:hypothetical protein